MGRTRGLVVGLTALIVFPPQRQQSLPRRQRCCDLPARRATSICAASPPARHETCGRSAPPLLPAPEASIPIRSPGTGTGPVGRPCRGFGGYGSLYEAAEVAPDDVWAVGDYETAGDNGSAGADAALGRDGVDLGSGADRVGTVQRVRERQRHPQPTTCWRQGFSCESGEGPCSSLAIRWNGASWQNASRITARSARSMCSRRTTHGGSGRAATAPRWPRIADGQSGTAVATPDLSPDHPLTAVSAMRKGRRMGGRPGHRPAAVLHRALGRDEVDGRPRTPWVPDISEQLTAISGTSADNVWLTGMNLDTATGILEHWDGTSLAQRQQPGHPSYSSRSCTTSRRSPGRTPGPWGGMTAPAG